MQEFPEGTIADGPNGPIVMRGGRWVPLNQGRIIPTPADPTAQFDVPKVEADIARTRTQTQGDAIGNTVAAGTAPTTIRTNEAPAGYMWIDPSNPSAGVLPIPGYTAPNQQQEPVPQEKLAALLALEKQIARVSQLYKDGPGRTKGVAGIQDYLPTAANERFDSAAAGLAEAATAVFRIAGSGDQNAAELAQKIAAQLPQASDNDARIEEKLRNIQTRVDAYKQAVGIPQYDLSRDRQNNWLGGSNPQMTAGAEGDAIKTEADLAMDARVNQMLAEGASLEEINAVLSRAGYGKLNRNQTQEQLEEFRRNGGRISVTPTGSRTRNQATLGAIATNPGFTALANTVDAASMGAFGALTGSRDELDATSEINPLAAMGGQIAGSLVGTAGVGALGRNTIGRALPRLMADTGRARFGRNLAADVAYGATYGGIADGDPLSGAISAGIGSVGGQALGKGVGALATGASLSPAVQTLRNAGVRTTAGRMLGPMASKIEDRAASIPIVGDMIQARQMDSFGDFNQAAFRQAGEPIGFNPQTTGYQGVQDFSDAVTKAYDDATAGVTAPFDQQFLADFAGATQRAQTLPPDLRKNLGQVLQARVAPLTDAGQMTGDQFQQATRALKATRNNPPQRFQGFEQDYRDAVSGTMDALSSQMGRADPNVVPKLEAANNAYRGLKTIENATQRAKGGSQSGELYTFTPSQLQMAIQASGRKFPGEQPLRALADAGQEVLPSTVPNSGTADRLMQAGGIAAIGGGGAGLGYLAGGGEGAQDGAQLSAALAILAALGGTKGGQKVLTGFLDPANRPAIASETRNALRKRLRKGGSGLFGSAGAGWALASGG